MNTWEKLENNILLKLEEKRWICNEMLTKQKNMQEILLSCFEMEDYKDVYYHRIGTGMIGGKACGMLAARALIKKEIPDFVDRMLPHESYYLGTDVFVSYLQKNGVMELWEKEDKSEEEIDELIFKINRGNFTKTIKEGMKKILEYYGNTPIIVRSSSLLEDGYGNAFSGKYDSIFCMNQGNEVERFSELEEAVKKIYTSMMCPSALEYRRKRKILDREEEMAVLIQKVEGKFWEDKYFPIIAGMGCSYNAYKWMEEIDPDAGMLRLVVGLGTKAVQRSQADYPRLVGLDRPNASLYTTVAERHRFSQRKVDVLEKKSGKMLTIPAEEITTLISNKYCRFAFSRDTEAEERLAQRGEYRKVYFADCSGAVENRKFMLKMAEILKMLERKYGCPVDVEYALDLREDGEIMINLFQCRPIRKGTVNRFQIESISDEKILFDVRRASVRESKEEKIDVVVWIDPQKYYECPYVHKADTAYVVGEINRHFGKTDKNLLLLAPGRIGTSSPELGVPVNYSDISNFRAICEVAYSKAGYSPELSYGSHMFQDLVEADIYYGAIEEGGTTRLYRPDMLKRYSNIFLKIFPDKERMGGIVKIFDVSSDEMRLLIDAKKGRVVCAVNKSKDI